MTEQTTNLTNVNPYAESTVEAQHERYAELITAIASLMTFGYDTRELLLTAQLETSGQRATRMLAYTIGLQQKLPPLDTAATADQVHIRASVFEYCICAVLEEQHPIAVSPQSTDAWKCIVSWFKGEQDITREHRMLMDEFGLMDTLLAQQWETLE